MEGAQPKCALGDSGLEGVDWRQQRVKGQGDRGPVAERHARVQNAGGWARVSLHTCRKLQFASCAHSVGLER